MLLHGDYHESLYSQPQILANPKIALLHAYLGLSGFGPVMPVPSTPLEALRSRWQSAAEAFCAERGLTPSLLGVVVSELQHEGEELPAGVHKFKQVIDSWGYLCCGLLDHSSLVVVHCFFQV